MSKKHYGKGGFTASPIVGDMAGDYYHAGHISGLKSALEIISRSANRGSAYKEIKLIVRTYGQNSRNERRRS